MLVCPKCRRHTRNFPTKEGVTLNFCFEGCKGIWFDKDELAVYCEMPANLPRLQESLLHRRETRYRCPVCPDSRLTELPYVPGEAPLVDMCESCHGVFLDARELARVEAAAARLEPMASRLKRAREYLESQGYQILDGRTGGKG